VSVAAEIYPVFRGFATEPPREKTTHCGVLPRQRVRQCYTQRAILTGGHFLAFPRESSYISFASL